MFIFEFVNRRIIVGGSSNIPSAHSVALFENYVYFTDWTKLAVMKANRFNLSLDVTQIGGSSDAVKPNGIRIVHSSLQPTGL